MSLSLTKKSCISLDSTKKESEKVSRVLLVCVYDTIVFEITNDLVY